MAQLFLQALMFLEKGALFAKTLHIVVMKQPKEWITAENLAETREGKTCRTLALLEANRKIISQKRVKKVN